ncbi:MAG: hypothetical protein AM326_10185 [Candidatus Thorarchaeota archaeon SMTZ-45]|nr:MAG: hypothetical protein AM326_10185 [Candidatus Thorarchaeota archaeon SMTZ-45]
MSSISQDRSGKRTQIAFALVLIITLSSIGVAVHFIPVATNNFDIQCMAIGDDGMGPNCIRVVGLFAPFDEDLTLQTLTCEPSVTGLNPLDTKTNESSYTTPFHGILSIDVYGDFVAGTEYQFTFQFLYDSDKVRTVYFAPVFTPGILSTYENTTESFGEQRVFWTPLSQPESTELSELNATLLAVGDSCYVYMANESIDILGESAAVSKCSQLGQIFDDVIYPKAVELAGSPDGHLGDIDGDPRVTLFLAPLVRYMGNAYLGFHVPWNECPFPFSNRREMVYIEAERDFDETVCITIHEFNHLIWDNYETDEADFLMEGLANLAIDYTGYWYYITDAVTTTYTYHPEVSLLHFNRFYGRLWDASYGQAYLFVTYLAERFGMSAVRDLVSICEDGPAAVEIALTNAGYDLTFNDVYLDFITACVLDNIEIEDGIYGFESWNYTIQSYTTLPSNYPIIRENVKHYHYGFNVYRLFALPDNFTINIEKLRPYAMGVVVAMRNSSGWYVFQSQFHSTSGAISKYIQSNGAEEAYVITTLMSDETPTDFEDVFELAEIPSASLDLSITEGDTEDQPRPDLIIIPVSILAIIALSSIFMVAKRKRWK